MIAPRKEAGLAFLVFGLLCFVPVCVQFFRGVSEVFEFAATLCGWVALVSLAISALCTPSHSFAPFAVLLCVFLGMQIEHGHTWYDRDALVSGYGWPLKWYDVVIVVDRTPHGHATSSIDVDWWRFLLSVIACGLAASPLLIPGLRRRFKGRRVVVSALPILALVLAAAVIAQASRHVRQQAQRRRCLENLRQINAAKAAWALVANRAEGAVASWADIDDYIKGGSNTTFCPMDPQKSCGSSYDLKSVGEIPVCKVNPRGHAFPRNARVVGMMIIVDRPEPSTR